jgi:predicted flap endonuclease-1-like 5' DNA nuclease
MMQTIEANWIVLSVALLVALLVAWWIFRRGSKGAQRSYRPDVLDEGAAPAQRNQALIDAPPAADLVPPPASVTMAGVGEIVSVAAQEEVAAASAAVSTSPASGDDLTRIKGLGPKLAALLGPLGVTSFAQIAEWDDAEIDRIDAQLGAFAGRIRRDNWVEQAKLLASGDTAAYEAKFGKL